MRRSACVGLRAAHRQTPRLAVLGVAACGLCRTSIDHRREASCATSPSRAGHADASCNAVLVKNGKPSAPWLSKERLLTEFTGAYTTARTVDGGSVFELSMHCARLHQTFTAVLRRSLEGSADSSENSRASREQALQFFESAGPAGIRPMVQQEMRVALDHLRAVGGSLDECQVTMVITSDSVDSDTPTGRGFDMLTFVQPLPFVKPMVDVEARRADRKNPTIKDTQWVSDRHYLEELQRQSGVNEVLMFDANGHVTEGLQTNFFAVSKGGVVFTAPDERVLAGTVRKVVLEACRQHGIDVQLECPSIDDVKTWESCFICSTSRLVKPVEVIAVPDRSVERRFPVVGSVAHRIEALVIDAVRSHSEPLTS